MSSQTGSPLVLGGHSFIEQLGNEPAAGPAEITEIVNACLDAGIRVFDTTYQPERRALGEALACLGRREEAELIAWNFFQDFEPGQAVGGPVAYQPDHLPRLLEQLQTDHIERLVIHPVESEAENRRQLELALAWRDAGHIRELGAWAPPQDVQALYPDGKPFAFMVCPYGLTAQSNSPIFLACKELGWTTFACSPFGRGYSLDQLLGVAASRSAEPITDLRARLADHMLRLALFGPGVDRLILAMRRKTWVPANLASAARGPLDQEELAWLQSFQQ